MSVKENLQADKLLRLNLAVDWSSHLPPVVWRGLRLTPTHADSMSLDLSHLSLAEALRTCHVDMNHLSFLKLCAFVTAENPGNPSSEISDLEKFWSFRWSEDARQLYGIFRQLPPSFQFWAEEKKAAFNDLRPLLRAEVKEVSPFLKKIADLQVSKSVGAEILERLCDLTKDELLKIQNLLHEQDPQKWLHELRALVQPLTLSKDQQRSEAVRAWPWPSRVKGLWKRQGDQAGLFVEIYSLEPEDLKTKLKSLEDLCERWRKEL